LPRLFARHCPAFSPVIARSARDAAIQGPQNGNAALAAPGLPRRSRLAMTVPFILQWETHGRVTAPLLGLALPPRNAVEQALRASARMQTDEAHPLGCLVVLSINACSPENRQALRAEERQRSRDGLRACVERAIATGTLQDSADAAALAAVFDTVLVGLSMQARDHVPLAALDAGISELMRVWDAIGVRASPNA